MNMKLLMIVILFIGYLFTCQLALAKQDSQQETALFKINQETHEIISLKEDIVSSLTMKFISVTTDQPLYWPNEEVFLKVVCPIRPSSKVNVSLQKKDSTPHELGPFSLNEAGILVETILSGKEKKLEAGEYRVEVHSADGTLDAYTSFAVVEGALGAVSFAYDFKEVTSPEELNEVQGAWFLGNAAGAGLRWGNGLNVKNEVRVFNQPFEGMATIKSRCYLPGCDGIEAGPPVDIHIKNGRLETVLDVGGHSGPFEIEVITEKGNVRYLFGRSGHIERQTIPVSSGFTNYFSATLAPYEGSVPVYGRGIYIIKDDQKPKDPVELATVVSGQTRNLTLSIKQKINQPRLFILSPDEKGNFQTQEIKLANQLDKGQEIQMTIDSPMTFIALGGFLEKKSEFYEGWAMVFTETSLDVEVNLPSEGYPLQKNVVEIKVTDRFLNQPASVYGILEVFDNRVASKSSREPLVSALGDSYRNLSNYLVSWRDWTGIDKEEKEGAGLFDQITSLVLGEGSAPKAMMAAPQPSLMGGGETQVSGEYVPQETIREGEKKVVYCGVFRTGADGRAQITVQLPPQTGRCSARVVVVDHYDYQESAQVIDVQKKNYVETDLSGLVMPGAVLYPRVQVVNTGSENLELRISGAGVEKPLTFSVEPGSQEIEFQFTGEKYGTLAFELFDSQGKICDRRMVEVRNVESLPVTFTDILLSNGNSIIVEPNRRIAVYSNPAQLLRGMITTIETNIYSWFGHAEAISAACALRATLLAVIEKGLLDDEGMRETLISELVKGVNDLESVFVDRSSDLIAPYPGLAGSPLWSVWVLKNLSIMVSNLEKIPEMQDELTSSTLKAQGLIDMLKKELLKRGLSEEEWSYYDPEKNGQDLIPVEIDGKVVSKVLTDKAVVQWFVDKVWPILIDAPVKNMKDINTRFITAYDTYRFLRAFEHSGVYYYLLLNAKSLLLQNDPHFFEVFNTITRGMIFTQDPGMIQGPALLGGVYSSPNTMVRFLDLLLTMLERQDLQTKPVLTEEIAGNKKEFTLGDEPVIFEPIDGKIQFSAPSFVVYQIDRLENIDLLDFLTDAQPFFTVSNKKNILSVGEESELRIELDKTKDPSEYYAVIVAPSVLSIRQTEDLLSDYKGQLLFGQKVSGGERIHLLTVPFRGSRDMILHLEGTMKGKSEGLVLVRHISNPEIIQTIKIPSVIVQ
jgi:hypothetical protein